ncbi:ATP-binding protein [Streptomyces sp. NPDC058417]|uniref:ATP-binding protein n=1 Tax=unclassified Streptomyces TaxID=2593676 RepID=UPI003647117D
METFTPPAPTPPAPTPPPRTAVFPRDRRSVRAARELARAALAEWGALDRADDVLLCVSELATNALLHGVPRNRLFRLALELGADGVLRVEVHDSGDGTVRVGEPGPDAEGGRGLGLVHALSDDWGVRERHPGKIVWCAFKPA